MGKAFQLVNEREKLLIESARELEYKQIEQGENLSIYFYLPRDLKEKQKRPAFLFFNGGTWDRGNVVQFAPHALYYVERGAVCGLVDYRNAASHPDSTPVDSIRDGITAIRFVRHHAEKLFVDPDKLVAFGAAAGANIAGCAAMKAHIPAEECEYNLSDSQPNGCVLFSPILDVVKDGYAYSRFEDPSQCRRACLSRYIAPGLPPMLIVHGTADRVFPVENVIEFSRKMKKKRNVCEFVDFEGRDQNFFNLNVDPVSYEACLTVVDEFLDRQGFLAKDETANEARLISWREQDY